jgi:hypothetical protein
MKGAFGWKEWLIVLFVLFLTIVASAIPGIIYGLFAGWSKLNAEVFAASAMVTAIFAFAAMRFVEWRKIRKFSDYLKIIKTSVKRHERNDIDFLFRATSFEEIVNWLSSDNGITLTNHQVRTLLCILRVKDIKLLPARMQSSKIGMQWSVDPTKRKLQNFLMEKSLNDVES